MTDLDLDVLRQHAERRTALGNYYSDGPGHRYDALCPWCTGIGHEYALTLLDRIAELEATVDRLEHALIEAQNPGIDMEQVRQARERRGL